MPSVKYDWRKSRRRRTNACSCRGVGFGNSCLWPDHGLSDCNHCHTRPGQAWQNRTAKALTIHPEAVEVFLKTQPSVRRYLNFLADTNTTASSCQQIRKRLKDGKLQPELWKEPQTFSHPMLTPAKVLIKADGCRMACITETVTSGCLWCDRDARLGRK